MMSGKVQIPLAMGLALALALGACTEKDKRLAFDGQYFRAKSAMVDKDQFHIEFEMCPTCRGTYFDAGEFRDLKDHTILERVSGLIATIRNNLD